MLVLVKKIAYVRVASYVSKQLNENWRISGKGRMLQAECKSGVSGSIVISLVTDIVLQGIGSIKSGRIVKINRI